jgi:hypothetical protein
VLVRRPSVADTPPGQCQSVHAEAATGPEVSGRVIRHPIAVAGTNPLVLGAAISREEEGDCALSDIAMAVVQVIVVVSAGPIIRNSADSGRVRHACEPVMSPRSSDQKPPGVRGWVDGNPRISRDSHGPGVHVPFVTSMVTPERGWTLDEHARVVRKRN